MVKLATILVSMFLWTCDAQDTNLRSRTLVLTPKPTSKRPTTKRPTGTKRPTSKRPTTKRSTTKPPTTGTMQDLTQDLPPGDEFSDSIIPPMEEIPDWILAKTVIPIQDIVDVVDSLPNAPQVMQDTVTTTLSSASEEENLLLSHVASVCATSHDDAFNQCKAIPVCKYLLDSAGNPTSTIKPNQGKCVSRCDAPLGASNCGARQVCVPYVLTCVTSGWN